jgi:hypothetical protein
MLLLLLAAVSAIIGLFNYFFFAWSLAALAALFWFDPAFPEVNAVACMYASFVPFARLANNEWWKDGPSLR